MALSGRPPRRSQRAEPPHWAPALGIGVEALFGQGSRTFAFGSHLFGKNPLTLPSDLASLASPAQRTAPVTLDLGSELADGVDLARNGVIPEVPSQNPHQPSTLRGDGAMSSPKNLFFELLQSCSKRFRMVRRFTRNFPRLVSAHTCVKPRKSKVSGLLRPRLPEFLAANRPNSIRRVFSGWSSSVNR
jgi:hypothetical protein